MNITTKKLGSSRRELVVGTHALGEVVPLDRYVLESMAYNWLNEYMADELCLGIGQASLDICNRQKH